MGLADQRAATSALLPNQVVPYAETYTLTIQRTIGSSYTAEVGYIGTRGIHLPTQDQINVQPRVNASNQLFTTIGSTVLSSGLPMEPITWMRSTHSRTSFLPWLAAGFTGKITSYQPFSSSNYNASRG